VPIDDYVRRKQIKLGRSLDGKVPIYLDINFWIIVRGVVDGTRTSAREVEFVRLFTERGCIRCPLLPDQRNHLR